MDLSRRNLLATAGAITAAAASAAPAFARWEPTEKYPDPAVQTLDPAFDKVKPPFQAAVERLMFGCRWAEGPVWMGDHRCVLWSDIPNNRILKWDEETGQTTIYRKPSNYSNGLTRDRQGRLLTCEHDTRRVTRTEYDGTVTVIADKFDGKPLNSPNDIVCKSDGSIWFTDPPFGILGNFEGHVATPEQATTNVYRVDGKTGQVAIATSEVNRPNGLAFSPDESKLYVVQATPPNRTIRVFDVTDNGTKLANNTVFIEAGAGTPDGFRVDVLGNLWCGWGQTEETNGVRIFSPEGKPIGHIWLPERAANLCFGGVKRNRLFMAGSQSLYSISTGTQGVLGG